MEEMFELPVQYLGRERAFPAQLVVTGGTYYF
jgi:hypothetical protein